jgi:hypothetical protein
MFGKNVNMTHMIFAFSLVMVASFFGDKFRKTFINNEHADDYEMVKKYLLNDSALYGNNRPKIWIHSKYEVNARKWKNFMSRNSTDLNQPYLYLTIQSIINHCGEDFHICLVDDESFEKLIPTWTMDLTTVPEPMRSRYRDKGMLELLYLYGGMIVPNSFLCTKPLMELYTTGISNKTPFMLEKQIRLPNAPQSKPFLPDMYFMGAEKEDILIQRMIQQISSLEGSGHFQNENEFCYKLSQWCMGQVEDQVLNLMEGQMIGIKTRIGKPVLLEDLMSDDYLDFDDFMFYGIYIPAEEVLRRPKYQYFAILPVAEVLKTDAIITKYFKVSIVSGTDNTFYKKKSSFVSTVAV